MLVTLDALQFTENVVSKDRKINTQYDVTDYKGESGCHIRFFYLFSLGDDIFRKLGRIESNHSSYTTLMFTDPFQALVKMFALQY